MTYSAEVLADSPVVYYRQGDASGSTMTDSSGSSRHASYVGSPTLGVTGALTGDADTAVTYNGTNQNGIVASGGAADVALKAMSGPFTLEAWVKVSSLTSNRGVLDRYGNGGATVSSWLWYIISGKPTFIVRNASNVDSSLTANTTLTNGSWAHIVATYDGTNQRVYLNGVLDCTPKASTFSSHNRTPLLNIAKFVSSSFFYAGTLDEVAIYDTALSATRIAAHFAAATPPATISGSFAATLPSPLTASFSGTYRDVGSFSVTLPHPLTASFSGTYSAPPTGTFSATLPAPLTATFSGTYTAPVNPAGTLDATLPSPLAASFDGQYHPHEAGTLDATLPSPLTASFAGTYTPELVTGSFAATLPSPLTADLSGDYSSLGDHGAFDAVLPRVVAAFVGTYDGPVATDMTNAFNGRRRHGIGTATVDRPAAALPPGRSFGVRYDKAIAYDRPDMVDGRPT